MSHPSLGCSAWDTSLAEQAADLLVAAPPTVGDHLAHGSTLRGHLRPLSAGPGLLASMMAGGVAKIAQQIAQRIAQRIAQQIAQQIARVVDAFAVVC